MFRNKTLYPPTRLECFQPYQITSNQSYFCALTKTPQQFAESICLIRCYFTQIIFPYSFTNIPIWKHIKTRLNSIRVWCIRKFPHFWITHVISYSVSAVNVRNKIMSEGPQPGGGRLGEDMWVPCTYYKSGCTLYEFSVTKTNMLTSPLKKCYTLPHPCFASVGRPLLQTVHFQKCS